MEYPLGKRTAPGFDVSSGFAGTAAEHEIVGSIAAPVLGTSSDEVPDVATLLLGPIAQGMAVDVR